jgi:glycosyltransferase involved in cell wall biosynthesis
LSGARTPEPGVVNVVLNFVPLKSGGGVQVGLDFIAQAKIHGGRHQWHLVATRGSPFADVVAAQNLRLARLIDQDLGHRLWFEHVGAARLCNTLEADVVYTQFGPHWPATRVPNVVGCAYSNLFYPEIDFWAGLDPARRLSRRAVDWARWRRLRRADVIIFETEELAARAARLLPGGGPQVTWVRPSASSLVSPERRHAEVQARCAALPAGFRILLLSAHHPNKNIGLLPEIARASAAGSPSAKLRFVTTLPPTHRLTRRLFETAHALGVSEALCNVGPVPADGCAELYRACDAVILPSRLESFSNTIAEAWVMSKPLIVSDMPWARNLCGAGAAYFRLEDPQDAARVIARVRDDADYRAALIAQGRFMLDSYPDPAQRFKAYQNIIESASGYAARAALAQ